MSNQQQTSGRIRRQQVGQFAIAISILIGSVWGAAVRGETLDYIFDWTVYQHSDVTIPGLAPLPPVGLYSVDWQAVLDIQAATNGVMAINLRNQTAPVNGGTDPSAIAMALGYIDSHGQHLDVVISAYENDNTIDQHEEILATVSRVRSHSNPEIAQAYIGNYDLQPGPYALWAVQEKYMDHTEAHEFYLNSDLNVAMPVMYPYSAYRNHYDHSSFGPHTCVSVPYALFWAPLERFSAAARHLPTGHKLIPWMAGFVDSGAGYPASFPRKVDCRALLQHARLRGANGYATWRSNNANYLSDQDYHEDMYLNAWKPLDWFFEDSGFQEVLNLATNKTGGVEWSGMRRGNHCIFIYSNFTNSPVTVTLPPIPGLPAHTPEIDPSEHRVIDYMIGEISSWRLNADMGSSVGNEVYSGPVGILSNGVRIEGVLGNAVSFDGISSEVSFGDVLDLGLNDRTICLWIRTNVNSGVQQSVLTNGYSTTGSQHSIFTLFGRVLCLMDLSGSDRIVSTSAAINDGQWHHIAVTIDRDDQIKLYLDGELEDQEAIALDAGVDAQDSYGFYLGRSAKGQYFDGDIDEVRVFDRVLREEDVRKMAMNPQ